MGAIIAAPEERTPDHIKHSIARIRFLAKRREAGIGDGGTK
ncbi:hypothetical protein [Bradyrhizobium sp. 141]|nr:hypothetical protein [Bradyrhizobium sp. 141]